MRIEADTVMVMKFATGTTVGLYVAGLLSTFLLNGGIEKLHTSSDYLLTAFLGLETIPVLLGTLIVFLNEGRIRD